jgi:hypothetical protein
VRSIGKLLASAASALMIAGVVVIARAPSSSGDVEMIAAASTAFAIFTCGLAAVALFMLVVARRSLRIPGAIVAGVIALAVLAAFPVERVWFQNEHSRGPVPLIQSLAMQRSAGSSDRGDFRPPPLRYSEVCCE